MPRAPLSEEHKQKMQAGRRKAGEAARQNAAERVRQFRAWLAADAAYRTAIRNSVPNVPENPGRIPVIPSDQDFAIADEEANRR